MTNLYSINKKKYSATLSGFRYSDWHNRLTTSLEQKASLKDQVQARLTSQDQLGGSDE
ncbi:MAG: hypothetical protein PUP92_33835 [Rhizonema sp. PD38]|nr:hypothetical protein [Rhizonema sp. PD38]